MELGTEQKNFGIVQICYGTFKARIRGGEKKDQSEAGRNECGEKGEKEAIKGASLHLSRQLVSTFAWQSPVA